MISQASRSLSGFGVVVGVVCKMAPLAQGFEVAWVAVFRVVVEVCDGKHDSAPGDGVRLSVFGPAVRVFRATLAAPARPFAD